jgi:hypothetical protein
VGWRCWVGRALLERGGLPDQQLEAHGIAPEDVERLRALFQSFEAQLAERATRGELDPDVEQALRSLGYVP